MVKKPTEASRHEKMSSLKLKIKKQLGLFKSLGMNDEDEHASMVKANNQDI